MCRYNFLFRNCLIITAVIFFSLITFSSYTQAAPLTAAEHTQLATLTSQLDMLRRILETLKVSFLTPVKAQTSSCTSALITLLGDGCHYMYNDSAGNQVFCDGPMTKSAKAGDTATTAGCTSGGGTPTTSSCPSGYHSMSDSSGTFCMSDTNSTVCQPIGGGATYTCTYGTTPTPTSPSPPSGSSATLEGSNVVIRWTDNSTNETEYKIERRPSGGTWAVIGSAGVLYGGTGTYNDLSVPAGTYEYLVKACNSVGCSQDATVASITVSGASTPPTAPTDLTASYSSSSNNVELRWTDVSYEDSIKISRRTTGGVWTQIGTNPAVTGATGIYFDSSVTAGTTYEYHINPCLSGTCSADSNTATVTTATGGGTTGDTTPPSAPTGLGTTTVSPNNMSFFWAGSSDNVAVTGYKVYRNSVYMTTVTVLTYSDTAVTPSTSYSYYVVAVDAAGNASAPSVILNVTTPVTSCPAGYYSIYDGGVNYCKSNTDPTTCQPVGGGATYTCPSGTTATTTTSSIPNPPYNRRAVLQNGTDVMVTWTDGSTNENEFRIEWSSPGSPSYYFLATVPPLYGGEGSYLHRSVYQTGTHGYTIKACNSAGCSAVGETAAVYIGGGGTATTTPPSSTCDSSLIALLGSGCHYMYSNSTGSQIFCDGPMTKSAKRGDATTTTGCSYSTTTTTSCPTGYHYMSDYSSYSSGTYCMSDTNSTICQPAGGGATYTCTYGTTPTPTGQKEQVWNSLGLRSWIRTDADATRIEQLKQACSTVPSSSNVWLPNAGVSTSPDFGMPDSAKCQRAASCTASQYFDGANCVASGTPTGTCDSTLINLLGSGCHYMYNDNSGNQIYCDGPMTKSAKRGDTTTTTGCSSGTNTGGGDANSCPGFAYSRWDNQSRRYCQLNTQFSCQYNYPNYLTQSNYNPTNCPAATQTPTYPFTFPGSGKICSNYQACFDYCKTTPGSGAGDSATCEVYFPGSTNQIISSCPAGYHYMGGYTSAYSYGGGSSGGYCMSDNNQSICQPLGGGATYTCPGTTPTTCDAALKGLLGEGCHYMYNDNAGLPIFCDGNMTKSAKQGDKVTTAGCQQGGPPTPTIFSVDTYNTYPREGERDVNNLIRIRVKFTKEIDLASTISQFFLLAPISNQTSSLNGSFQFLGEGFEFVPNVPLQTGTTYIYKVFATLKERGGTSLSAPFSATFTTAGSGTDTTVATLEGSVKDADGQPVANAPIQIFKEDFTSKFGAVSAADGSFQVFLPAGKYIVEVYPPYEKRDLLRPAPIKVTVASGSKQVITLLFTTSPKAVSGTVKFSGGDPVTDAEVGAYSLDSYQWKSTLVDSKGAYTLRLSGGKWKMGIRPKDTATIKWSYTGSFPEISFTKDSNSEFQIIDFTIPLTDATLNVVTVDEKDRVLADTGVVVDTLSSGQRPEEGIGSSPKFKITDSTGNAKFTLRSGRYYIRGYIAPDRGYLNPPEQEVTTVSGRIVDARLVFKKQTAASSISLKGIAKLEEGIPTDAFVWGWSERGGYASTLSSSVDGSFEFKVGPNERWHIGSGKVVKNIPYKSAEIVVEIKEVPVNIEIILAKFGKEELPPPVVIKETATKQIVAQADDGAKAVIPPQAAGSSGSVSVEVKPTAEAPSQAASQVISTVYDVSIRDSAGKAITNLNSEIEITIPYDEAELKANGVSEDNIIPSYFDEKTGTWVKVDNFTIDKDKNIVISRVKHLTRFGLVAPADTTPPSAPASLGAVALGEGKIKITWKNPNQDFAYARVYRSDKSGELGKIVAAQVKGQQHTDDTVIDGIVYYYTVRSADPAGNESNNQDQTNIKAVGTAKTNAVPTQVMQKGVPPGQMVKLNILRSLNLGSKGDEVKSLQQLLLKEGVYPNGLVSGYFGKLTKEAVVRFQEKYANEVLKPYGLTKGSGLVGPGTRKKMNELLSK